MIISVLAVSISLLGIFLLLYEMYQVAREYTRSAQLDRENQLLAVESAATPSLRGLVLEQTRHLRHDFRQHLHVIAGLTEAGQLEELKNYLCQYESELSEERPTLCANPPWTRWPGTTTMRPASSACRWNGGWNCPASCPSRKPDPLHDAGQPAGKCIPCSQSSARAAAGEG